jgi:UDP-N-acetyl-D-glucosamine/UDP-N-acetyl-D-galactosamine dehydrogenase
MNNKKICLIGLDYVGLPLAVEFGKKFEIISLISMKSEFKILKRVRVGCYEF